MKLIKFILFCALIINYANAQNKKIAFCSNNGTNGFLQVFSMKEDGTGKTQLTNLNENCMRPKWSPDGKQITFYTDRGYVYLIRDSEKPNLNHTFLVWGGYYPSFNIDGTEIIFNSEFEDILSVFSIDTASFGAEPQLWTDGSYSNMQILSQDGKKMVFSAFNEGTKSIMIMDLEDTTENYITKISLNDEANLEPDISSDNSKIVYASFDNNLKGTIRILENGKEKALTKGLGSSNIPRFSPDGKKIAFVVIGDKAVSLYVMNADGSAQRNLNADGGNIGTFLWIDNNRIAYDAGSETSTVIGIINTETGDNEIIAEGGFNLHPAVQK